MTSVTLNSTLAKPRPAVARDTAIDFTKGVLVLFMVLYHWLNYFVGVQGQYYNYLRFLTPSFLFITGFMISQVHMQRYGAESRHLPTRLMVRGLKLLALFVGLNILIGLVLPDSLVPRSFVGSPLPSSLVSVFVTGNITNDAGQKNSAFNILIPIAYLLIVSAGLTLLCKRIKYAFHYACILLMLSGFLLGRQGMPNVYLDLLMIGVLGVIFGYATRDQIALVVSYPYVLCGLYCVYLAAITIWDVTLPVQVTGVILTTTLFFIIGKNRGEPGMIRRHAILLGKYSLFGYVSQIAILQVLRRMPWFFQHGITTLVCSLLLGFALTIIVVVLMDWTRMRSKMVGRLYQLAFA